MQNHRLQRDGMGQRPQCYWIHFSTDVHAALRLDTFSRGAFG